MLNQSKLVKLYKNDSKGKLRFWAAWADNGFVHTVSGIVGREDTSTIEDFYLAEPKNVGKKNETTSVRQAELEVNSLYRAKVEKKRYFHDMVTAQGYVSQDVQLAHDYTKKNNHKKVKWGAVDGQYKLDGVRCRITVDRKVGVLRVWSRENKPYSLPDKLYHDVLHLFHDHPELNKLDGELYKHGVDLEDVISMVKDVEHPERECLEFWMYDTIEPDKTWVERKALIEGVGTHAYGQIIRVESFPLASIEEGRALLDKAVELGFEGLILRNHCGLYKCGVRSYDLQKWKLFEDAEFECIGIVLDKRGHAVHVFVAPNGKTFNSRRKASNAKRLHDAQHPEESVGFKWTVRYQRITAEGVPLFPVTIARRDYE